LKTRKVVVFGSSTTAQGSSAWNAAEEAGRVLARSGLDVITGGYGGTMEAVSRGAALAGGHVIGVTLPSLFPGRSGANQYVAELVETPSLTERIGTMLGLASGALTLPGSIGTATELLVTWNLNNIAGKSSRAPFPSVAVGAEWRRVGLVLAEAAGAIFEEIYWEDDVVSGVQRLLALLKIR
jgi:uncharacterized protein (TIGR00725 family)